MKLLEKFKIYYLKIINSNGTPHGIALAVAIGIFIGCFLPIGTQTIPVLLIAILFRVDKLLAFLASWICNPYTVPVLYPVFCYTGSKIMGLGLTFSQIEKNVLGLCHSFSWHNLGALGIELGVSFFIGGFLYGLIFGLAGYFFTKYSITRYRKSKKQL